MLEGCALLMDTTRKPEEAVVILAPFISLYGLGYPRQPSPQVTISHISFIQTFVRGSRTRLVGNATEKTLVSELSRLGRRYNFSSTFHSAVADVPPPPLILGKKRRND